MDYTKIKSINQLAESLIEVLEIDKYPIPIEEIPHMIGGKLTYVENLDGDMEALIRKENDSFEIIISQAKPLRRQKFSIAHELGHLFLHMGYLLNDDLWNGVGDYKDSVYYRFGYSSEEAEANEFAAALLMPRKIFKQKYLNEFKYNIEAVANYFGVSAEAAAIRGRKVGLLDWR